MQSCGLAAGAAIVGAPYVSRARAADGIVWYSTSSARSVEDWANLFTEKTGVPVETFRSGGVKMAQKYEAEVMADQVRCSVMDSRSEEHTSELQSLMRISYAVFCLKKKKTQIIH